MTRYAKYKDSGVEWLGEVPAHWEIKKLKYIVDLTTDDAEVRHGDFQVALENIESWTGRYIETYNDYAGSGGAFEEDDLLFNKLRPYLAKVFHAKEPGTTVGELLVLRPKPEINSRFLFYRLVSRKFIDVVDGATYGAKMPRASWDFIGDLHIPLPSFNEQRARAVYLDRKTQQIDALIAKKRRLIELLREQRTAIINRAVTKGLDPNAPMRDSGIEWLGEVPAHWELRQLKHLCRFIGGGTPSKAIASFWSGSIPWVSPKDMKTDFLNDTIDHISQAAVEGSTMSIVGAGNVLLVVRSGILKHTIPVAINVIPVALNQDMKAMETDDCLLPEFLRYYISGNQKDLLLQWRKQGATVESIEQRYLADALIPLPSIDDQAIVTNFLEDKTEQIDALVVREQKLIDKLQELRASLISEVVTGKIDVRNAATVPEEVYA